MGAEGQRMSLLLLPPARGFALRDYQLAMVDGAEAAWAKGARAVLNQAPTGAGKSVCQAELIRRALAQGRQVLVAVHRIELIHQLARSFKHHTGITPQLVIAGSQPDWSAPLLVGMNPTLHRRGNHIPSDLGLFVQDECHHSVARTYRDVLEALPAGCFVSGWTATPARTDGSGFRDLFDELIPGPSTRWLIEQGHLSPYLYLADPSPMRTKGIRKLAGDFSIADLARANDSATLSAGVVDAYRKHCPGLQAVVFAINVEHSQAIAAAFNAAGIPAAHLDGEAVTEGRQQTVEQFRQGNLRVLTNVGLFGEGFDVPALEAVIMARPTCSLALFLQMIGRALRYAPGKTARIVDLAQNWTRHGLPRDEREWSLDGVERQVRDLEVVDDEVRERRPRDIEISEGDAELVELDPDVVREWRQSFVRLVQQQQERGHSHGWLWHQLRRSGDAPLTAWEQLAELMGRKRGWAWHQWRCWTLRLDEGDYPQQRARWAEMDAREDLLLPPIRASRTLADFFQEPVPPEFKDLLEVVVDGCRNGNTEDVLGVLRAIAWESPCEKLRFWRCVPEDVQRRLAG